MDEQNRETHRPTGSGPLPSLPAAEALKAAKRTIADSVFTNLFKIPRYTFELYKTLHPEDTKTAESDIRIVTLQNILLNQCYNDLGFLAGDRMLILVEAQSTWSDNILLRGLLYIAQTVQEHIIATRQSLYAPRKVSVPRPEIYVIYTGEGTRPRDEIHLAETFFPEGKSCLDLTVRVISRSDEKNIIGQYIAFTAVCREQFRRWGRTRRAVREIVRICQDRDLLKEFLASREKEVFDIMFTLYDQEKTLSQYLEAMNRESLDEGIRIGRAQGIEQGIEQGIAEEKTTNAVRMLKRSLSPELIGDITGFTVPQLRQLARENNIACSF